ncbi:MAG: hypothetical protein QOG45_218, partial [Chloroflexota bacterium]|nr:hypothetical protein [Chloroflexota bacterium]
VSGGGPGAMLGLMRGTLVQVFGYAVDVLFLLTGGITAVGVVLAVMLPTGRPRRAPAA